MKILNLYAGIGGNRRLWGDEHEVVAVEYDESIAAIYQDLYPNDTVIVADAHKYLLDVHRQGLFDFIWSSPPCPTHSRMNFLLNQKESYTPRYPDMKLYEEIILLKTFYKGYWVVENVKSYYDPLIEPQVSGGHYFWANFEIPNLDTRKKVRNDKGYTLQKKMEDKGIIIQDFHGYKKDKRTLLNNAIEGELGLAILNQIDKEEVSNA
jgi:DNA (cytosine-5)-methyltransferase 1|tara:strand:- start:2057 stop:2680 length:624 start_codon:yes stop_codon:yes gene_type:complete